MNTYLNTDKKTDIYETLSCILTYLYIDIRNTK